MAGFGDKMLTEMITSQRMIGRGAGGGKKTGKGEGNVGVSESSNVEKESSVKSGNFGTNKKSSDWKERDRTKTEDEERKEGKGPETWICGSKERPQPRKTRGKGLTESASSGL